MVRRQTSMSPSLAADRQALVGEAHRAMHGRRWDGALVAVRAALQLCAPGEVRQVEPALMHLRAWFGRRLDVVHLAGARRRGSSLARAFAHTYVHVAGSLVKARRVAAARLILERCEAWLRAAATVDPSLPRSGP